MSYVTYEDVNPTKISGTAPIKRSFKNGEICYHEVPLFYNYGTEAEPIVNDFYLELPEVDSYGIVTKSENKEGKNGPYVKTKNSMMFKFSMNNPEVAKSVQKLEEAYKTTARVVGTYKGPLKQPFFDPEKPEASYKNPIYFHIDEATGERIVGRDPSLWVKLTDYPKTLFTAPLGNGEKEATPIDWELLKNVEMKLIPLLHIKHIYVGTKMTLQVFLISAVVTKVIQSGTESKQVSTFERLRTQRPDLADEVASQLAQLQMTHQDKIEMNRVDENQFNQQSNETAESMDEFLGAAPSMTVPQQQYHQQAPVNAQQPYQPQQQFQQAPQQQYQAPVNVQPQQQPQQQPSSAPVSLQLNNQAPQAPSSAQPTLRFN